MRFRIAFILFGLLAFSAAAVVASSESEEEYVKRFMQKMEKKHTKKLAWVSGHYSLNRINRDNDYNKFAIHESSNFPTTSLSWLGEATIFGFDMGLVFNERFAWSLGGEYWLKMGQSLDGIYFYDPAGTNIENPSSEITVYGFSTGLQYYFWNHPTVEGKLENLALRVGGTVGYYQASWDVWSEYQNLNLATNTPATGNTTFKDSNIGFSVNLGADYPLKFFGLVAGLDMGYLYLNFDNVAWYNTAEQEVVASYTGDSEGRVDLGLSGVRGKIEIKRFFSW